MTLVELWNGAQGQVEKKVLKELETELRIYPVNEQVWASARLLADVHRMGREHVVLMNDPRDVRDVLMTNQRNFLKGRGLERAKGMPGEGLPTSEEDVHLRQRRLMQPAFHRERIAS